MKKNAPLLLILLVAFGLRIYRLDSAPPGLTHDEADHAWEGITVLSGIFRYYFPLGYGREPLYGYTLAGAFSLLGQSQFSLRLINVFASMLAMAGTFRWVKGAFSRRTALLTCAFLAVGFWSLTISRQALRSSLMPMLFIMSVMGLWHLLNNGRRKMLAILLIAVSIGLSLHNYMSSRLTWTIFPIFVVYMGMINREKIRTAWKPILFATLLGLALGAPLFIFLNQNPGLESRIGQLLDPITALQNGNVIPLWENMTAAILAFFIPGRGDTFLAYNLPGRQYYHWITAVFSLIGLALTLWRWKTPAYGFLLLWLGIGLAPSLITGPEAGITRGIGAFTAVYILPAIGLSAVVSGKWLVGSGKQSSISNLQSPTQSAKSPNLPIVLIPILFAIIAFSTFTDYFSNWAERPDVRGAYQSTLIEMLDYYETSPNIDKSLPTVVSSVFTDPAHNAAIALFLEPELGKNGIWVDGRLGMLFRGEGEMQMLTSDATPLHPIFASFAAQIDAVALRTDDLDPNFQVLRLSADTHQNLFLPDVNVNFNDALTLVKAGWLAKEVPAGGVAEFVTVWEIDNPSLAGQPAPPIGHLDMSLFTHIMADEQNILAQSDRLDAPSWLWQAGDVIVQVHQIYIPPETDAGVYKSAVGLYDRHTGNRTPIVSGDISHDENRAFVEEIEIIK